MDDSIELTACYYCGMVADSTDHVPPLTVRNRLAAAGLMDRYPFRTVPCCRECNSALGPRAPFSLMERKRWVKAWIRRRYAKYLKIPPWEDNEIGHLGPVLQGYVLAGIERQRVVLERLRW